MSKACARKGDLWAGVCVCHPPIPVIGMAGPIVTASGHTVVDNKGDARLLDATVGFCGHPGVIVSASRNTQTDHRGQARVTSAVVGCVIGAVVTGSGHTVGE